MLSATTLTEHERGARGFRYRVTALALGLLLTSFSTTLALDPKTLPSQYQAASWQEELPQNTIQAILQSRDGYLWIGTQGGLVRFDGQRFVEIQGHSAAAAVSPDVRALLEDRNGTLWVGTRGQGLLKVAGDSLERVGSPEGPAPDLVFALAQGEDGGLWVGTRQEGLLHFRDGRFTDLAQEGGAAEEDGFGSERILSLLRDSRGRLWVGALGGGLRLWQDSRFRAVGADVLGTDSVVCLFEDRRQRLWIGTRGSGLFVLAADRSASPRLVSTVGGEAVMDVTEDRDGNLWLATYGRGLVRLAGAASADFEETSGPPREDFLTSQVGLTRDEVMVVFEDREGNLWAGTEGGGLNRFRDTPFRTFGRPEGLATDQIWAVLADRQGSVWLGTEGEGLFRLRQGKVEHWGVAEGLGHDAVTALLESRDGSLWVGSRGQGIQRLRQGRLEPAIFGQGAAKGANNGTVQATDLPTVLAMLEDRQGSLWLGTQRDGLLRFDHGQLQEVPVAAPLRGQLILALAQGPAGELILGTSAGVYVLRPGPVPRLDAVAGLADDTVFALHVETTGTIWAGTYGGGLVRIAGDRFPGGLQRFGRAQGLASDVVLQILEGDGGALWLASNQGVSRVDKAQLEAVARGERSTVAATTFAKADGMRAAECNGGYQPAGSKDPTGRLWFPTIRGVVTVNPAHLHTNPLPPPVVIEGIHVDGVPLADRTAASTFAAGRRRYEFFYTALSFSAPERVRFRYRLEGYDPDWIEAGGERRATYTSLPGGRGYRFQVIAANDAGVWNEVGASYSFVVKPFFYQRPAFLIFAAALLGALAWGGYQLRLRQLLRRTAHLEALVGQRTQEVVEQRDHLRVANEELTHLNEFKDEFLGIAAHDLKNPLSVIYGYAGVVAEEAETNPRLLRIARRISTSASQMVNIVSDILDTTALESGKLQLDLEHFDLAEVVQGIVDRYQIAADERDIELVAQASAPALLHADKEKLTRVCENLISNGIRYSRRSTRVIVRLVRTEAATIDGQESQPTVRLSVEDEGPGLTPEQIDRIFNRFERLAEKHQVVRHSTGLGLSIVKQFVELHQGRVWVQSEPGQGSIFHVELPGA